MADKQGKTMQRTSFFDADISIGRIARNAVIGSNASDQASVSMDEEGNVVVTESEKSATLPQQEVYKRIADATQDTLSRLKQTYEWTHSEAKRQFRSSLIAATMGLLIVLVGVSVVLMGHTLAGVLTSASSIVFELVAVLYFLQLRESHKRENNCRQRLLETEDIHRAIELIPILTTDEETQNRLKETIILRILDLPANGEEMSPSLLMQQLENENYKVTPAGTTNNTLKQLERIYEQNHRHGKHWFRLSLIAANIGILFILGGIITILTLNAIAGLVITVASAIPGVSAVLFFRQLREANKRENKYRKILLETEGIHRAIELIPTLTTDEETQDHLKETIILRTLGLGLSGTG